MLNLVTYRRNPWSIFDELDSLQEDMDRAFGFGRGPGRKRSRSGLQTHYPPMNVWSSKDGLIIEAEVPGADAGDIEVSVKNDQLVLRGKVAGGPEDAAYTRRERPSGDFERALQLPFRADANGVKANYRNGVLRLTVPRSEDEKPKKIKIEAA